MKIAIIKFGEEISNSPNIFYFSKDISTQELNQNIKTLIKAQNYIVIADKLPAQIDPREVHILYDYDLWTLLLRNGTWAVSVIENYKKLTERNFYNNKIVLYTDEFVSPSFFYIENAVVIVCGPETRHIEDYLRNADLCVYKMPNWTPPQTDGAQIYINLDEFKQQWIAQLIQEQA